MGEIHHEPLGVASGGLPAHMNLSHEEALPLAIAGGFVMVPVKDERGNRTGKFHLYHKVRTPRAKDKKRRRQGGAS